jgi:hypothetical protein
MQRISSFITLLCLFVVVVVSTKGVIELDEKTFDRVVSNSKLDVLVAVVEYSWKDPDNYDTLVDSIDNM